MANPIVHSEPVGDDGDTQTAFYESLFDWELNPVPGFDSYHILDKEAAGRVGGVAGKGPEEGPVA